jgi:hypothetical protein
MSDHSHDLEVSFRLLIMRSRVRFPVLPWGLFLEGEDSHGLGSSVELGFKAPPGTSYPVAYPEIFFRGGGGGCFRQEFF